MLNSDGQALSEEMQDSLMLLFWKKGFYGTTIQDLSVATGLNRATLYKNFHGKQGLFELMLNRFRNKVVMQAVQQLVDPTFGMQGISEFFKQFLTYQHEMITSHGYFMIAIAASLPSDEPEAAAVIEEFIHYLRSLFYKNLRWQQSEKMLLTEINTEMMADFFAGHVVTLINLVRLGVDARMLTNQVQGILFYMDLITTKKHASAPIMLHTLR